MKLKTKSGCQDKPKNPLMIKQCFHLVFGEKLRACLVKLVVILSVPKASEYKTLAKDWLGNLNISFRLEVFRFV